MSSTQARQRRSSASSAAQAAVRVDVAERLPLGDAERDGQWLTRRDGDRRRLAGFDPMCRAALEREGGVVPTADQSRRRDARHGAGGGVRRGEDRSRRRPRPARRSAVSRRTSSVVGSRLPVTSATIASVSVSRPCCASQVVSSVAVPGRYAARDDSCGARRTQRKVPAPGRRRGDRRPVGRRSGGRTSSRWRRRRRRAPRCGCRRAARSPRWVARGAGPLSALRAARRGRCRRRGGRRSPRWGLCAVVEARAGRAAPARRWKPARRDPKPSGDGRRAAAGRAP